MEKYKKSYDVVVVGCGPGGAMAGKFAALNGARVLVIDKKREIGMPSSDTSSAIFDLSELENIIGFSFDRARVCEYRLFGTGFISPGGKYGGMQEWVDAYGVNRPDLEKALAISAAREGAEIWMNTRFLDVVRENGKVTGVILQKGAEIFSVDCKIIIGADGIYSAVSKSANVKMPNDIFLHLGFEMVNVKRLIPVEKPFFESYLVPQIAPGMACWVSPRGEDRFGVGVTFQPQLLKTKKTAEDLFGKFKQHLEDIGRFDFSQAAELAMMSGASTVSKTAPEKYVTDSFLFVGDAAWRPLLSSNWGSTGIPIACSTGRMAGETAAEAIKKGDVSEKNLNAYVERLNSTFTESDKAAISEGREYLAKLMSADISRQDEIIEAIGDLYSSLDLFRRGALPMAGCVAKIKEWWEKNPN